VRLVKVRVGVAQRLLLHLAHGVARQRVDEQHPLRLLEAGEAALQRVADRRLVEGGALCEHDDRRHALAEVGMRQPDDGAFGDAGDLVDLVLDLLRIDIVAAGDDQVLAAADDRGRSRARRSPRGRR
jgi:hypothetical protein